jgi:predicted Zn-dependent peptidase
MNQPIRKKLRNKSELIYIEEPNAKATTIMFLVKVGSRYENSKESGIAHFVEHMMFKGTKSRPSSKAVGMAIETIGGSSNAFTSNDYTGYYIKVPEFNSNEALPILVDMLTEGLFDQKEIEKERGVIIEEIRMYEDRPMNKVRSFWEEKFFGNTPLGRDIAGSIETVSSFNREDLIQFIAKHYGSKNLYVVIAGKIDIEESEVFLNNSMDKLSQQVDSRYRKYKETKIESAVHNLRKPIEQSHIVVGTYSLNRSDEDRYKLKVFSSILGSGFGSRLFQVIRDELGLAYYVYANQQSYDDIGVYQIGLGVENTKVFKAVEAVMKEISNIMKGDFSDEELERAKNFMLGNLITDFETTDDLAYWYGLQILHHDKFRTPDEVMNLVRDVKRADVVEIANRIFKDQSFMLAAVSPHEELDRKINGVLNL